MELFILTYSIMIVGLAAATWGFFRVWDWTAADTKTPRSVSADDPERHRTAQDLDLQP